MFGMFLQVKTLSGNRVLNYKDILVLFKHVTKAGENHKL